MEDIITDTILNNNPKIDIKPSFDQFIKESKERIKDDDDIMKKELLDKQPTTPVKLEQPKDLKKEENVKKQPVSKCPIVKGGCNRNIVVKVLIIVSVIVLISLIVGFCYLTITKKTKECNLMLNSEVDKVKQEYENKLAESRNMFLSYQTEKQQMEEQIKSMSEVIQSQQNELLDNHKRFNMMSASSSKQPKHSRKPSIKSGSVNVCDELEEFEEPDVEPEEQEDNEYVVEHQKFTDAPIKAKNKEMNPNQLTKKYINSKSQSSFNTKMSAIQQEDVKKKQRDIDYEQDQIALSNELGVGRSVVNESKMKSAIAKIEESLENSDDENDDLIETGEVDDKNKYDDSITESLVINH